MPITLLDIIVIGVMLISAVLAMVRGFTRELLAIGAWAAAIVAAFMFYTLLLPFARQYINNEMLASVASGGVIFLVTLVIVSFITIRISDMILDSRIGAIDRTLGFIFGAARGLLLAVIAFIFVTNSTGPDKQPAWFRDAKSHEILDAGGRWVLSLLPQDPNSPILRFFKLDFLLPNNAQQGGSQNEPAEPADPGP